MSASVFAKTSSGSRSSRPEGRGIGAAGASCARLVVGGRTPAARADDIIKAERVRPFIICPFQSCFVSPVSAEACI